MIHSPSSGSQGFQASGTYGMSAVQTVQYGTGNVTNGSTTTPLYAYYRYPTGVDPKVAIPLVIVLSGGGFDNTFVSAASSHLHLNYWTALCTAGAVIMAIDYRTCDDTPWNHADTSTDTAKRKATRAARIDQNNGFDWAISYDRRVTANYTIDPRRVFVVGWSAGGQSTIRLGAARPTQIRGMVGYSCEIGLNISFADPSTSDDHTRDIRAEVVETAITASTPPIQLYMTDNDTICPPAGDLVARVLSVGSPHPAPVVITSVASEVGYHDGPAQFLNQETVRVWFNTLMSGLSSARTGRLTFS